MKQSPIFVRTYDLLRWLIPATVKFPRSQRFVLARMVQWTALQFQERLIEAALGQEPKARLVEADVLLTKLRFYLRLCCSQQQSSSQLQRQQRVSGDGVRSLSEKGR